jgi:dolichol-phosphate mannosyltransferase
VLGSRYVPGGSIPNNWGWHRKLISRLGNAVARMVLTLKLHDFTSGFRATRRHVLWDVLPDRFISDHYAYKLQLLWQLHQHQARIYEYPIEFIDRTKGVSKLPANSIIDSLRVLIVLKLRSVKGYLTMCCVGLSSALLQFGIYNALRQTLSPLHAIQGAIFVAVLNSFLLNSRITFKHTHPKTTAQKARSFGLFLAYSALMMMVQSVWLQLGITLVGAGVWTENILMVGGIIIGSVINYFTYSRFIWPRPVDNSKASCGSPALDSETTPRVEESKF